jgi:hypothetical protein
VAHLPLRRGSGGDSPLNAWSAWAEFHVHVPDGVVADEIKHGNLYVYSRIKDGADMSNLRPTHPVPRHTGAATAGVRADTEVTRGRISYGHLVGLDQIVKDCSTGNLHMVIGMGSCHSKVPRRPCW